MRTELIQSNLKEIVQLEEERDKAVDILAKNFMHGYLVGLGFLDEGVGYVNFGMVIETEFRKFENILILKTSKNQNHNVSLFAKNKLLHIFDTEEEAENFIKEQEKLVNFNESHKNR